MGVHDPRSIAGVPKNAAWLLRDLVRYRDFDRVVAVGDRVDESLRAAPQRWSVPADRLRLIPNGVPAEGQAFDSESRSAIRSGLGFADDTTVVACVGRLHVQKRLDRALRAAAVLRERGHGGRIRFLFVGDGPDEGRLRALAEDLGLSDEVRFVGRLDAAQVRRYYSASDISLLTTARREGLPMAVLEALAAGLPCVVSRGAIGGRGLADVLVEVDTGDAEQLAAALTELAARVGPLTPSGTRPSRLPAEYHLGHCARAYLAVFDDVVRPDSAP